MIIMSFLIKNRPTLTCMLQAKTPERIYELIDKGLAGGADAFGLQLEQLERKYHTEEIFREIIKRSEKPIYVTNYIYVQNEGIDYEVLADELIKMAALGAELIDIPGDFYCEAADQITYDQAAIGKQKALIEKIHSLGKRALISSHTYRFMDFNSVLTILDEQKNRGADICKIVTAAENEAQLKTNIETSARLLKDFNREVLFLCVGESCALHRRLGPIISGGMFLCVAEHDELSTPAQPLLSDAKQIVDIIYGKKI